MVKYVDPGYRFARTRADGAWHRVKLYHGELNHKSLCGRRPKRCASDQWAIAVDALSDSEPVCLSCECIKKEWLDKRV